MPGRTIRSYQIVMNAQATNEMVTDQEAGVFALGCTACSCVIYPGGWGVFAESRQFHLAFDPALKQ